MVTVKISIIYAIRGAQTFQKSRSHIKILGIRKVT